MPGLVASVLSSLALGVVSTPAAGASSTVGLRPPNGMRVLASEDFNQAVTPDLLRIWMPIARKQCPTKTVAVRTPKLSTALQAAERLVEQRAGARAMRAFRSSPDYRKPNRLAASAALAGAGGRPLAALAALLREQRLTPRDPLPLVDAAAILSEMRKPQEALALLDRASQLRSPAQLGMGMNPQAVALADRGYALLRLGQFKAARSVLDQAIKREPDLSEARTTRSAIDLCQSRTSVAYDKGLYRHIPWIAGPGPVKPPDPSKVIVEYEGFPPGTGRSPQYPNAPANDDQVYEADQTGTYDKLYQQHLAANVAAKTGYENALKSYLAKTDNPVAKRMIVAMKDEMWNINLTGAGRVWMDALQEFDHTQIGECSSNLGTWKAAYNRSADAAAKFAIAESKAADGYTHAIRDPVARQALWLLAQTFIEMTETDEAEALGAGVQAIGCGTPETVSPGDTKVDLTRNGGCVDKGKKLSFEVLELEQQCEKLSVKVKEPGWIGLFGKLTYNLHDGSLTVLVGGRVSTGAPLVPGTKVSAETGMYVKLSANNKVQDIGWQMPKTTVSAGAGPVSATIASSGGEKISFIASASDWGGTTF